MLGYIDILDHITVGNKDKPQTELTKEQAKELLKQVIGDLTVAYTKKDDSYETKSYYLYVAEFPCPHVAVDNRVGTTRYFSFYTQQDYDNNKKVFLRHAK